MLKGISGKILDMPFKKGLRVNCLLSCLSICGYFFWLYPIMLIIIEIIKRTAAEAPAAKT